MKVLFIVPRFHTNMYFQAKVLQESGVEVKVVALYKGFSEFHKDISYEEIGYSHIYLFFSKIINFFKRKYLKNSLELRFGFPSMLTLRKVIKSYNPDIILLKGYQDMLTVATIISRIGLGGVIVAMSQTRKGTLLKTKQALRLYFNLFSWLGVREYLTPIKETITILKEFGLAAHYSPFIFPAGGKRLKYFRDGKINIISVGKFVERKDFLTLLKATNSIGNVENVRVKLIGEKADEKYYEKIKKYIEDEKLSNIVTIKYNMGYLDTLDEYKSSDLFILPSYNEPAAYSIVEAMANGLLVIATDDCGTNCYIKEGENGLIFKAKDFSQLRLIMDDLIANKEKIVTMGAKSYNYLLSNHQGKNFVNIIKKIHAKSSASNCN